jgi:hypothetical protein
MIQAASLWPSMIRKEKRCLSGLESLIFVRESTFVFSRLFRWIFPKTAERWSELALASSFKEHLCGREAKASKKKNKKKKEEKEERKEYNNGNCRLIKKTRPWSRYPARSRPCNLRRYLWRCFQMQQEHQDSPL